MQDSPRSYQRGVANTLALIAAVVGILGLLGWKFVYGGPHGYIHLVLFLPMAAGGLGLAGSILLLDRRGRSASVLALAVLLLGTAIWVGWPLLFVAWALITG